MRYQVVLKKKRFLTKETFVRMGGCWWGGCGVVYFEVRGGGGRVVDFEMEFAFRFCAEQKLRTIGTLESWTFVRVFYGHVHLQVNL